MWVYTDGITNANSFRTRQLVSTNMAFMLSVNAVHSAGTAVTIVGIFFKIRSRTNGSSSLTRRMMASRNGPFNASAPALAAMSMHTSASSSRAVRYGSSSRCNAIFKNSEMKVGNGMTPTNCVIPRMALARTSGSWSWINRNADGKISDATSSGLKTSAYAPKSLDIASLTRQDGSSTAALTMGKSSAAAAVASSEPITLRAFRYGSRFSVPMRRTVGYSSVAKDLITCCWFDGVVWRRGDVV